MVEETGNSMNMQPAEEEYEYEYIELAEGEELPEGAEYEYEYVEVPAEEILAAAGQSENLAEEYVTASEQIQEDIPQFFREDADVLTADLAETASNEPVFEIEQPGSQPEAENEFDFETVEQVVDEPADFGADFLAQANGELNLDDILDDDSPLPDINVQTDDDFEKSLFGTPEPDLQLEHFESEIGHRPLQKNCRKRWLRQQRIWKKCRLRQRVLKL